jgi:hypothetical protein
MKFGKNHIIVTSIISLGFVLSWGLYLYYAYQTDIMKKNKERFYLTSNSRGFSYEIDRETGKTWLITSSYKKEIEDSSKKKKPSSTSFELPKSQLSRINLLSGQTLLYTLKYPDDAIKIHFGMLNETDWNIKSVTFLITVKNDKNQLITKKEYTGSIYMPIGRTDKVDFTIYDVGKNQSWENITYKLIKASAYKK